MDPPPPRQIAASPLELLPVYAPHAADAPSAPAISLQPIEPRAQNINQQLPMAQLELEAEPDRERPRHACRFVSILPDDLIGSLESSIPLFQLSSRF
jgi:hypothetical protein